MFIRSIVLPSIILTLSALTAFAQSNTGRVFGTVVDKQGNRVLGATVKCEQLDGKRRCTAKRTNENGEFWLVDAPLKRLKITAIKYETREVFIGEARAYCEQDKSKWTDPKPIKVKQQATQQAKASSSDRNATIVTMIPISLTRPISPQEPSQTNRDSGPSTLSGAVVTQDKSSPGLIRMVITNDETDELLFPHVPEIVLRGSFSLPIPSDGKYKLEFSADGYYPATYLIIKQAPGVTRVGNTTEQLIPFLVIQTDGTQVDNAQAMTVTLLPIEKPREEGLGQLTNTDDATRRKVFHPTLMESLPVAGTRSFDTFALLSPGVLPAPQSLGTEGPGVSPGVGTAGQFSMNGLRSRENNFNVDGSDNNDEDLGIRRQGFVFLAPQGIESIGEFQIITALADSRFGRNIGGQVNVVTKTGEKYLHGSVYGFFTNQTFNSRDPLDQVENGHAPSFAITRSIDNSPVTLDGRPLVLRNPVEGKDPFSRRQLGFTSGGPLPLTDDAFFFTSFEGVRTRARKESHFAVPTVSQRGAFDSGETGLLTLTGVGFVPLFPTSVPGAALFSLYPFPNNPLGPYGQNTHTRGLPADVDGRQFSVKIEKRLGRPDTDPKLHLRDFFWIASGDVVTGRYNITQDARTIPVTGGALFSSLRPHVRTQNVSFFLNRTLRTNVTDAIRLSFGRTRLTFDEVRDPFLLPSSFFPNTPFLLNAPLLVNVTAPNANGTLNPTSYISASSPQGAALLNSMGYSANTQVEQIAGALGRVVIPGFSSVGVDVTYFPQARSNNTFQVADTIAYQRGENLFTFGFDIRKNQINSVQERDFRPTAMFNGFNADASTDLLNLFSPNLTRLPARTFSGSTLAAAGVPTGLFQTLAVVPNSSLAIRFTQTNFFVQFDRNLTPRLRVNLGMRYEMNTVPSTVNERLEGAFDPVELRRDIETAMPVCALLAGLAACDKFGNDLASLFPADFKVSFGSDTNDFNARVGFAWQPFKDSRTVIRGGFGTYTGQFNGFVLGQLRNTFPDYLPLNFANSPRQAPLGLREYLFNPPNLEFPPIPNVLVPGTLNTLPSIESPVFLLINRLGVLQRLALLGGLRRLPGLNLVLPQKELISPYSLQYGVTAERQLGANTVASIAYVGTRGIKLLRTSTPEGGLNYSRFESILDPVGVLQNIVSVRPLGNSAFPSFGALVMPSQTSIVDNALAVPRTLFESSASSSYNSLQADIRKRYSRNFQFGSALTYSHSIDDVSDYLDLAGSFALPQDSTRRSERASSNFDLRWRSVSHFVFDLPFRRLHLHSDRAGTLQIAGIVTAQSGQPFTVNSAFDINRDGNLTDRLNTTDGLSSGTGRTQLRLTPGLDPRLLLAPDGRNGAVGRNTFRAPPVFSLDLAVTAHIPLTEQSKLLYRIEIFNFLNRANYGIPGRILEAPGFGNSINTVVPSRTIQFGLKYQY